MNKPILIWIDDWRNPKNFLSGSVFTKYEVVWCKSYNEFEVTLTNREFPSVVFFDHDLGDRVRDGKDCADLLIDFCMKNGYKLPEYYSQSQNPVGKKNILGVLDSFKRFQEK